MGKVRVMLPSHQRFRPVSAVKLLEIMMKNRSWSKNFCGILSVSQNTVMNLNNVMNINFFNCKQEDSIGFRLTQHMRRHFEGVLKKQGGIGLRR